MFASWKKARGASLVVAAAATFGAFAPPADALEGVQGRHAIFYPSLELVYQHDDNFFLTPTDEISADTFIAHAHFRLEVPGARQFVQFEYAPQWRNVNVNSGRYDLEEDTTHFWLLDADLKGSSIFGVDIRHDFMMGALEGYAIDPNVAEMITDQGESFWRNDIDIDFKWDGSKQGVAIMVGKEDTSFDNPADAPKWFELNAWNLGAEYHYRFAPLTNFIAGYMYTHNTQDYTKALDASGDPLIADSIENRVWFGVKGELGRTTTGSARAGFTTLNYDSNISSTADYEGFSLRADVTKSFSRWTKLAFNAERTPNFSAYEGGMGLNYYYISNRASFTLSNQPQGARVGWTVIGQFQRNGWDVGEREDDLIRLRGEVGFHPLEHLSFRLNFEHKDNDSNDDSKDFVDNLVILQVQFGF